MKSYHFQSDHRQIGGLLMLLSFNAMIHALGYLVASFQPGGAVNTDASSTSFWYMITAITAFVWGFVGSIVGYMACVHDWSQKHLNMFMMVGIQTFWIGYIAVMVETGRGARMPVEEQMFVPLTYGPTHSEVAFFGAMGILGMVCYGFAFAGSVAFMTWALHAYTIDMPHTRDGFFYKGRMHLYGGALFAAGLVQFLVGCVCRRSYGAGPFKDGPVYIAYLWTIVYPGINIFVGLVQMINAVWGLCRAHGMSFFGMPKHFYQLSLLAQWFFVTALQCAVTFAYYGTAMWGMAVGFATFALPLTLMPAFLDYKHMNMPDTFETEDFYGPFDISHHETKDEEKDGVPESAVVE